LSIDDARIVNAPSPSKTTVPCRFGEGNGGNFPRGKPRRNGTGATGVSSVVVGKPDVSRR
jgi:hypothetical protein